MSWWNILLIWPSGSWKTTIRKKIIYHKKEYNFFIAETSRIKRDWEKNWKDYFFVDSDTIIEKHKNLENYFIEKYFSKYYWYNFKNVNLDTNLIVTPWIKTAEDILDLKERFWFKLSILLDIDLKTFKKRLESRWETLEEINKRKSSLNFLDLKNKIDLILNWNESIENLTKKILNNI